MTFFNTINSMTSALARLRNYVGEAAKFISQSPRPTDAFPIVDAQPLFVLHPDYLDGWKLRVDHDILKRLSMFGRTDVLVVSEELIQAQPYALAPTELAAFRAGTPVLKMRLPIHIRSSLSKGGRTKDSIEIALRNAMTFEVYRRDIELRAIEALRAKRDGRNVDPTEIPQISMLADLVWVEDFPQKRRQVEANSEGNGPADTDSWCDVLAALRDEGRKIAVEKADGAIQPEEVQAAIIADIFSHDAPDLTFADFDDASAETARHVALLMRAYRHATRITEHKHNLSARLRKHLSFSDRRRIRPYDPVQFEVMTKLDHTIISANNFTAKEMVEIAMVADVDPNLLCPSHTLAFVEFGIARKLGRYGRSGRCEDATFSAIELECLQYYVLPETPSQRTSMFEDLHEILADYAVELDPLWEWHARIAADACR